MLITGWITGDYVAYTTPKTKETRRSDWKKLNFAGTVDWAVDLQSFTRDDLDAVDPNDTCDKYKPVFSNENMPQGSFTPSWATAPENAAHSGKQYITIGTQFSSHFGCKYILTIPMLQ